MKTHFILFCYLKHIIFKIFFKRVFQIPLQSETQIQKFIEKMKFWNFFGIILWSVSVKLKHIVEDIIYSMFHKMIYENLRNLFFDEKSFKSFGKSLLRNNVYWMNMIFSIDCKNLLLNSEILLVNKHQMMKQQFENFIINKKMFHSNISSINFSHMFLKTFLKICYWWHIFRKSLKMDLNFIWNRII